MKVVCPNCRTAFQMPDSALDPSGRWVKCGSCAHVWRVYPEQEQAQEAGPPAAPSEDAATPAAAEGFGAGSYDDADDSEEPYQQAGDDIMPDDPFAALQASAAPADTDTGHDDAGYDAFAAVRDDDNDDLSLSPDDDAVYGAAGLPALPARRSRLVALGWIAYIVFMAVLVGGLILFRAPLVAAWPPLEGLYAAFEDTRPTAEEAFRVEIDPQPVWEQDGDDWTMTVSGTVTNRSDLTLALPPLQIELVDQRSASVRTQEARIERRRLDPDESATFSVTIRNAPEQARGIDYRWEIPGE